MDVFIFLAAEKLIRNEEVSVTTSDGKERKLRVGGCPECIIPEIWIENGTPETLNLTVSKLKSISSSLIIDQFRRRGGYTVLLFYLLS